MQFPPMEASAGCGWVVVFKAEVGCGMVKAGTGMAGLTLMGGSK